MGDRKKNGYWGLVVLVLPLLFFLINVKMNGIPGIVIFALAELPLSFLPDYNGDHALVFAIIYGIIWPVIIFGAYVIGVNKAVPEKWKKSPKIYRSLFAILVAVVMSIAMALPFHLYALMKS